MSLQLLVRRLKLSVNLLQLRLSPKRCLLELHALLFDSFSLIAVRVDLVREHDQPHAEEERNGRRNDQVIPRLAEPRIEAIKRFG